MSCGGAKFPQLETTVLSPLFKKLDLAPEHKSAVSSYGSAGRLHTVSIFGVVVVVVIRYEYS